MIGLCQFIVTADKTKNLTTARNAIDHAVHKGADVIVLPEVWNSPYSNASFDEYSEPIPSLHTLSKDIDPMTSPSTSMLSLAAKSHQKYIIGGSIPERVEFDGQRVLYNSCSVFNPEGEIVGKFRKIHLFDIDVPGKMTFFESNTLSGGSDLCIVEIEGITDDPFKIGIGICYDLRFSELAEIYRQNGCSMVVYPAAFNTTTGPLHWELLQRARAADNQMFIATCSPSRDRESSGYPVWGHSMVTDPWSMVIDKLDENEGVLVAEIDLDRIQDVRGSIPILDQKRHDLYEPIMSKM